MDPAELSAPTEAPDEAVGAEALEHDGLEPVEAAIMEPGAPPDAEAGVLEDVEFDGQTYQVPKALKGALLRHADYTRKTQELAEERRSLEAERTADAATQNLQAGVAAIEQRMAACEDIDWDALWRQDPQGAQQLSEHLDELAGAHAELSEALEDWRQVRAAAEAQDQALSLQAGHAELSREIPGWSPELGARLAAFAMTEFGASPREVEEIYDPRIVKLLHAAYVGANSRGLSREAQRHVEAQTSRPAATVGGRAAVGKSPNRMTTDEWMRHRNKQLRAAR